MEDNLERLTRERDKVQSQLQQISDEIARLANALNNGLDDYKRDEAIMKLQRLQNEEFPNLQRRLYDLVQILS